MDTNVLPQWSSVSSVGKFNLNLSLRKTCYHYQIQLLVKPVLISTNHNYKIIIVRVKWYQNINLLRLGEAKWMGLLTLINHLPINSRCDGERFECEVDFLQLLRPLFTVQVVNASPIQWVLMRVIGRGDSVTSLFSTSHSNVTLSSSHVVNTGISAFESSWKGNFILNKLVNNAE